MENTIDELSDDVFLQNSPDDLIEAISQAGYLQPVELLKDQGVSHPPIEITNTGVWGSPVPISGFRYAIEVPYTGASGLFNHQPDTYDLDKPTAQLNSHSMQGRVVQRTSNHPAKSSPTSSAGCRRFTISTRPGRCLAGTRPLICRLAALSRGVGKQRCFDALRMSVSSIPRSEDYWIVCPAESVAL
jgi:hypothetical protein